MLMLSFGGYGFLKTWISHRIIEMYVDFTGRCSSTTTLRMDICWSFSKRSLVFLQGSQFPSATILCAAVQHQAHCREQANLRTGPLATPNRRLCVASKPQILKPKILERKPDSMNTRMTQPLLDVASRIQVSVRQNRMHITMEYLRGAFFCVMLLLQLFVAMPCQLIEARTLDPNPKPKTLEPELSTLHPEPQAQILHVQFLRIQL